MRTARTIYGKTGDGTVVLDLLDAMELSEVLDYLNDWLTGTSDDVRADLNRFGGDDSATKTVCHRLTAFTELIITGEAEDDDIYPGRDPDHHSHDGVDQRTDRDKRW
jgi:hypothetical protein